VVHQVAVLRQEVAGAGRVVVRTDQRVESGILRERGGNLLDRVRLDENVGVDEEKDIAGSVPGAEVARSRRTAAPFRREQARAGLSRGFCGGIGRAVVHHDDLVGPLGLPSEPLQTFPQELGGIVDWNDDRNGRTHALFQVYARQPGMRRVQGTLLWGGMIAEWIDGLSFRGPVVLLRSFADIAVLSFLLYQFVRAVRGTRGAPAAIGMGLFMGLYYVAGWLGLTAIHGLLDPVAPYFPIVVLITFQAEIRTMLREMALQFSPSGRANKKLYYEYEDVVFAVSQLAHSRVGALIVIERETGLKTFIQSGVALDARLSSDLLVSIFQRSSPLHDGGVIIQRERIAAAACFLPLTTNPGLVSSLGTRHRAAIGITEETDCLSIIVSEENGRISVAAFGEVELGVTLRRLDERIAQHFGHGGPGQLPPEEAPGDIPLNSETPDWLKTRTR
jgi:diadenylate cyclase